LTAVEKAAGLDRSQTQVSREMLAEHGNMSSPTILMILERLRNAGASTPCVAIAFGPGLVAEAVLIV
jgi:predicted naringenin-chalcone synthase